MGLGERQRRQIKFPEAALEGGLGLFILSIPFGAGPSSQPLRSCAVGAILISMIWIRIVRSRRDPAVQYSLVIPMMTFVASFLLAPLLRGELTTAIGAGRFIPIAILFFFGVQEYLRSNREVRRFAGIVAGMLLLLSSDCIYQIAVGKSLFSDQMLFAGRVTGSLPNPNDVGLAVILLPIPLTVFALRATWRARGLMSLCLVAVSIAALLSQSRNAWLGLTTGALILLPFLSRWRLALCIAITVVVSLAVASVTVDSNLGARIQSILNPDLSAEGRIGLGVVAWNMFLDAPVVGLGSGAFGDQYLAYASRIHWQDWYQPEIAIIPWAHNLYLEALCERGFVGLIALLWLVAATLSRVVSLLRRSRNLEIHRFAIGLAAAIAAFCAMGMFDLTFLKDWVWLVWCTLAGAAASLSRLDSEIVSGPAGSSTRATET